MSTHVDSDGAADRGQDGESGDPRGAGLALRDTRFRIAGWRIPDGRGFWAAWTALAAVTIALSVSARITDRFPGDLRIARAVQSIHVPLAGGLLDFANTVGSPWPAVTIIVVLTLGLALLHRWRLAMFFPSVNALRGVGSLVKGGVNRPRPDAALVHVTDHATGASFPSGHVFSAVLLYGALAVVVEMLPLPRLVRRAVQCLCLAIVALMGPARVYAGAHWPSDVLGGYLWGVLLLLLAVQISRRWLLVVRTVTEAATGAGPS